MSSLLSVKGITDFLYGHAPQPVTCGRGITIGAGTVYPEINFTLPTMDISARTWPTVCEHYSSMVQAVVDRAVALEVPGVVVEFETLPPMTENPRWGLEITAILGDCLRKAHDKHGLKSALRLTPNDTREFLRPPVMRSGKYWDGMVEFFDGAAEAGADMIAIESTGGKEVCDEALMNADLRMVVFALGVLGARDMAFLWKTIVASCQRQGIVPSGDTACGFANTAMVLAEQKMIPRLFAAVVRVASVPRSLVAYTVGARGPSKDCAYEGPYMKALAGVPISMEGRSAACAHLSPVGNIAQSVCDLWSNESVQRVRLLSDFAPVVSMEQLAYDCRLMNTASCCGHADATKLRDWLTESDASLDPQAYVLRPDVVLRLSERIAAEKTPYAQTVAAVRAAVDELRWAFEDGRVRIAEREQSWIALLEAQAEDLPETEEELIAEVMASGEARKFLPEQYGIG
ncbi:MAG: methanol---5-hydroxybenzimidazolylcobamide Co-methyltransferase [Candidatus Sumerlaeota bacterium]|nr:methanol---5-hydroxybenzimidazolylcobamide Co-methyltransferase [Candidatus Sumerlaeota bacterium]